MKQITVTPLNAEQTVNYTQRLQNAGVPNFASKNEAIHHAVTTLIRYVEDYEKHYTTGLMPQKMKDKLLDFIKPQLKLFDI